MRRVRLAFGAVQAVAHRSFGNTAFRILGSNFKIATVILVFGASHGKSGYMFSYFFDRSQAAIRPSWQDR
jgi:hypothetical protein